MTGRSMVAWFFLALLALGVSGWLCEALLWAQEGALEQADRLEQQRQQLSGRSAEQKSPPVAPEVYYDREGRDEELAQKSRWGNMNWYAIYFVLAGVITFFVFRGAAR